MKTANILVAITLSALMCGVAAAGVSGTSVQRTGGHTGIERDRVPCGQCHGTACTRGKAIDLGLRQPCLPVSARAHLRPR